MRAKTILTMLFLASLAVAAIVLIRALPQNSDASTEATAKDEILVATVPLERGAFLRAEDVTWQPIARAPGPGEIVRPPLAAREAKPGLDEEVRTQVNGAALRGTVTPGQPIRRSDFVKPGERDFLQLVLSPGARAVAIPVTTGGASTGLLFAGDRVDVLLTQKFLEAGPLTRRSVGETVVEGLRVLAISAADAKTGNTFGQTVTLEVTPEQAEKINVAVELGKLSLTLRSATNLEGVAATSSAGVKPTWAGDVSPALGGAVSDKGITAQRPSVEIIRGKGLEVRKVE